MSKTQASVIFAKIYIEKILETARLINRKSSEKIIFSVINDLINEILKHHSSLVQNNDFFLNYIVYISWN